MKRTLHLTSHSTLALAFSLPLGASTLAILPHPNANELASRIFVETFAGLNITSFSGGIGTTEPFFDTSDIPGLSMNIWGTFQALYPFGIPSSFNILGAHMTEGGSTFTPPFGSFNFSGHTSVMFTNSQAFNMVTFSASDLRLPFPVNGSGGDFRLMIDADLPSGSSIIFKPGRPASQAELVCLACNCANCAYRDPCITIEDDPANLIEQLRHVTDQPLCSRFRPLANGKRSASEGGG
jgi:hypothetical protein